MQLTIHTEWDIGDVVYRKVDDECKAGIVTEIDIYVRQGAQFLQYSCVFPGEETLFYWEVELSSTPVPKLTSKEEQDG